MFIKFLCVPGVRQVFTYKVQRIHDSALRLHILFSQFTNTGNCFSLALFKLIDDLKKNFLIVGKDSL